MVTIQRSKNCELLDYFCMEEQVLSLTYLLNRFWSHALKPKHRKAQDLLYEPRVPRYDYSPRIVGIKSLPAILPIVTYLLQPFWSIKSGALTPKAQKNAMRSTFDRSGVWSNVASSNSRSMHDTSSRPTSTPFGPTDGSVLFRIWRFLQYFRSTQ